MKTKHYLPPLGTVDLWHVTIADKTGAVLEHRTAEDEKEAQAIATIARGNDLSTVIFVRSPLGRVYPWA